MIKSFFKEEKAEKRNCAVFLSGSGSNAETLLEYARKNGDACPYNVCVLVTDRREGCRAPELAEKFQLPLVTVDIKSFYRERGLESTSLATERGRQVREEWTEVLRQELKKYPLEFGILAGFVPLTNLTGDFPCLNVHPGDLTKVNANLQRCYVGLHAVPVELALLAGEEYLRSSVIIASDYAGSGAGMDGGPLLGVSKPMKVELGGHTIEELKQVFAGRVNGKCPKEGDLLRQVASQNQELLKVAGDWVVFPPTVADFASGKYACSSEDGSIYYKVNDSWQKIQAVEYDRNGAPTIL